MDSSAEGACGPSEGGSDGAGGESTGDGACASVCVCGCVRCVSLGVRHVCVSEVCLCPLHLCDCVCVSVHAGLDMDVRLWG